MDAADIADELPIQEHPKVIVAKEVIFQRAFVIRRQVEVDGEIHAEEPVVVVAVIALREVRRKARPVVAVRFGKALEAARRAVLAPQRIRPPGRAIHRPEVVREDVRVGLAGIRRGVEEILQAAERVALPVGVLQGCRAQGVGIAHPVEGQRAVGIGLLAGGVAVVEQPRRYDPLVVADGAVAVQTLGEAEGCAAVVGVFARIV